MYCISTQSVFKQSNTGGSGSSWLFEPFLLIGARQLRALGSFLMTFWFWSSGVAWVLWLSSISWLGELLNYGCIITLSSIKLSECLDCMWRLNLGSDVYIFTFLTSSINLSLCVAHKWTLGFEPMLCGNCPLSPDTGFISTVV